MLGATIAGTGHLSRIDQECVAGRWLWDRWVQRDFSMGRQNGCILPLRAYLRRQSEHVHAGARGPRQFFSQCDVERNRGKVTCVSNVHVEFIDRIGRAAMEVEGRHNKAVCVREVRRRVVCSIRCNWERKPRGVAPILRLLIS